MITISTASTASTCDYSKQQQNLTRDYAKQLQNLNRVSNNISSNTSTSCNSELSAFIKVSNKVLKTEFNCFTTLSNQMPANRAKQWASLGITLGVEKSPYMLKYMVVDGTHPTFHARALKSFLKSEDYCKFRNLPTENPSTSEHFAGIENNLKSLLKPYLKTLLTINAIKLLAWEPQQNLPGILNQWLSSVVKLDQYEELLYPISWRLPTQNHFILSRVSVNASELVVDIFDAAPKMKDKSVVNFTPKTLTSFTVSKDISLKRQLELLCNTIPLDLPKHSEQFTAYFARELEAHQQCPKDANKIAEKLAYSYLAFGCTDTKIVPERPRPLQHMSTQSGANCVVASFQMLLFTLADEYAVQNGLSELDQLHLKNYCQDFLVVFKNHVAKKLNLSQIDD